MEIFHVAYHVVHSMQLLKGEGILRQTGGSCCHENEIWK